METKPSQSPKVDAYMQKFQHPLKDVMVELRKIIMQTDKSIGEEIKWNAPTFFYAGPMEPSDPKLHKRYLMVSHVHRQDEIMLVLLHAAAVDDGSGFLDGDYKDGRRLIHFRRLDELHDKKQELTKIIHALLRKYKQ